MTASGDGSIENAHDHLRGLRETARHRGHEKMLLALVWMLRWRFTSMDVLSNLLGVGRSQTYALIQRLIRRGLCTKFDARRCDVPLLILTPAGAARALEAYPTYECASMEPLTSESRYFSDHPIHDLHVQKLVIEWTRRYPKTKFRNERELLHMDIKFCGRSKVPDAVLYYRYVGCDDVESIAVEVQESGARREYFERVVGQYALELASENLSALLYASSNAVILNDIQSIILGRVRPFRYCSDRKRWEAVERADDPVSPGLVQNCFMFVDLDPFAQRPQLHKPG